MSCNGDCKDCNCNKKEPVVDWSHHIYKDSAAVWDESGYPIGSDGKYNLPINEERSISYKYAEDKILADLKAHLDATYSEHYATEEQGIECFDAWIALGDSTPTFRNTALKYLWRYGKKNGNNKKDLMKALHYIFMCLYVDHYRSKND